jgi:hypothetical protein
MNICSCGSMFNDRGLQCARCEALQVLGLGKDATETEIRTNYQLFVKAWSPESMQGDSALKAAAENKLTDMHTAYEYLSMTSTERTEHPRPVYLTSRAASPEATHAVPAQQTATAGFTTLVVIPSPPPPPGPTLSQRFKAFYRAWRRTRVLLWLAVIVVTLLTGKRIRDFFRTERARSEQAASLTAVGNQDGATAGEGTNENPRQGSKPAVQSLTARSSASATGTQRAGARQPAEAHIPMTRTIHSYLTVGSTRDEVLAQQGPPTAQSEDKLVYGKSELYLKNNLVTGWRIDLASSPIRVKLWPQTAIDPDLAYFAAGSTKDEVLVVQGTPTAFTDDKFEYGGSEVYFRNNRVVSWKDDPGSVPLKVRQ